MDCRCVICGCCKHDHGGWRHEWAGGEMRHEHDWRRGPVLDFIGRTPMLCADCLARRSMPYEEAQKYPAWTAADYERDAERIERTFG